MNAVDITIVLLLVVFTAAGWKSGMIKKLVALLFLAISLVIATKYSASVGDTLLGSTGFSPGTLFIIAFIVIVIGIMIAQSALYKVFMKKLVEGLWNSIGGAVIGLLEGILILSISLIVFSIYFQMPSDESKATSTLYKPVKNFAPAVFDEMNTMLPESDDFYQEFFNAVSSKLKQGSKR